MQAHHDGIAPQVPDQILDHPERFFIEGHCLDIVPDHPPDDAGVGPETDLVARCGLCAEDYAKVAEIK